MAVSLLNPRHFSRAELFVDGKYIWVEYVTNKWCRLTYPRIFPYSPQDVFYTAPPEGAGVVPLAELNIEIERMFPDAARECYWDKQEIRGNALFRFRWTQGHEWVLLDAISWSPVVGALELYP